VSSKIFSSQCQSHDLVESESSHKNFRVVRLQARVNVESHEISHFLYYIFYATQWRPTCYKMAPDKLENGAQRCFNKFDCRLFISKFSQFAFYLSFSLSVISKSLAQLCCKCCNHSVSVVLVSVVLVSVVSVSVVLNVRFATNRMYVKNYIHICVSQASRNRMSTTWDLACCLLPQCEALHTCRLGFPITTK